MVCRNNTMLFCKNCILCCLFTYHIAHGSSFYIFWQFNQQQSKQSVKKTPTKKKTTSKKKTSTKNTQNTQNVAENSTSNSNTVNNTTSETTMMDDDENDNYWR